MTSAITCHGAMPLAKTWVKVWTPRTDKPIRTRCSTGWRVFMAARPWRQMNEAESAVASAYCQKTSDCALKPIL